MVKRFWPLLIVIIIIVLAAVIIPVAASLIPHVEKRIDLNDPNTIYTILSLDLPTANFPDDVKKDQPLVISGHLYQIARTYIEKINDLVMAEAGETGWVFLDKFEGLLQDSLTTDGATTPLSSRTVSVYTEYSNIMRTWDVRYVLTDQDGYFQATMKIDDISNWNKFFAAFYKGEKQEVTGLVKDIQYHMGIIQITYMPSFAYIPEQGNGSPPYPLDLSNSGLKALLNVYIIPIVLCSFAGTLLAIIAYFIYRYRKKLLAWLKRRKVFRAIPEQVNIETPEESITAVDEISRANREISAGDARVEILFPQVEYPLPPVWGIGEPLTIQSHTLVDKPASDIKSQPQISTSYGAIDITVSGYSPLQLEHTFDSKGEIRINVHFGSDPGEKISGTRKIRIVDYREEIVALFNQLIDSLATKGVKVARMMTAREIEMKLKEKYPDLESDVMQVIVKGFEYADYSLHPVARKIYIEVYLAAVRIGERFKNA
jgi:hypothetical protein